VAHIIYDCRGVSQHYGATSFDEALKGGESRAVWNERSLREIQRRESETDTNSAQARSYLESLGALGQNEDSSYLTGYKADQEGGTRYRPEQSARKDAGEGIARLRCCSTFQVW